MVVEVERDLSGVGGRVRARSGSRGAGEGERGDEGSSSIGEGAEEKDDVKAERRFGVDVVGRMKSGRKLDVDAVELVPPLLPEPDLDISIDALPTSSISAIQGQTTSFATFNIHLIPNRLSTFGSLAFNSEPSQIPGKISLGPCSYGNSSSISSGSPASTSVEAAEGGK